MIVRRILTMAITLMASLWGSGAFAACYSAGACNCVVALTSVAFGTYDRLSPAPTDTVGNLSISCISGDPADSTFTIALSPGSSGNANARTMLKGATPLFYNLYIDAARTAVWGDDSAGQSVTSSFPAASRTAKMFNIYGRIVAFQNVAAGPYRDSITVTVTY